MKRSLILLRGINVSGHNKVPMADLRAALTDAGLVNVATYIQSGNIAVDSDTDAKDLGQLVEQIVLESFDVAVPAVVIAQSEIQYILDNAPFAPDADPGSGPGIFEMRGVSEEAGAMIVVRPDQHVAHVLPLDGYDDLAAFFDGFMVRN